MEGGGCLSSGANCQTLVDQVEPGIFGLGSRSFTQGMTQISVAKVGVGAGLGGPQEELGGAAASMTRSAEDSSETKGLVVFIMRSKLWGGGHGGALRVGGFPPFPLMFSSLSSVMLELCLLCPVQRSSRQARLC